MEVAVVVVVCARGGMCFPGRAGADRAGGGAGPPLYRAARKRAGSACLLGLDLRHRPRQRRANSAPSGRAPRSSGQNITFVGRFHFYKSHKFEKKRIFFLLPKFSSKFQIFYRSDHFEKIVFIYYLPNFKYCTKVIIWGKK